MRPLLLCRERLIRLLAVLDREGGSCSLRDIFRTYGVCNWEVGQAEEAGWVTISTRKPAVGRSSQVAEKLSETHSAKLPPWRYAIPKELSCRHFNFALHLSIIGPKRNAFGFGLQSATDAYLRSFPSCKSRAGAAASASRLMKRPMIQAARSWFLATDLHSCHERIPATVTGIYRRLAELREGQRKLNEQRRG
jgi:hypothetical protein